MILYLDKIRNFIKGKMKRIPLKKSHSMAFMFLIVIPLLVVLVVSLFTLNQRFKKQAIENIERAQDKVVTELLSDINVMSMRFSHFIYTNNNEVIGYAAGTDTSELEVRHEYMQKLFQAGNLALEPVKDIVAVGFYMKDGNEIYIKNTLRKGIEEIREESWYQEALEKPNIVSLGSYDILELNDLYSGGKKDSLILIFAFSPDVTTDRSQKIEMIAFYQMTDAGNTIKEYDQNYLKGNNKLGVTRIVDSEGRLIFATTEEMDFSEKEYTCVKKPVRFGETVWYVESYIRTSELTEDFWHVAQMILVIAVCIFLLAGWYFAHFLKNIVQPITDINDGLKQVEQGNLEVHIPPQGQFEIRTMIHQFNAMVRRLRALIEEYEEKSRNTERKPEDYFSAMLKGEMSPQEVSIRFPSFFAERYTVLIFMVEAYSPEGAEAESARQLMSSFERNPRFASRCVIYMESPSAFMVYYRIAEEDYLPTISRMIKELQATARREMGVKFSACIGRLCEDYGMLLSEVHKIREVSCLDLLYGEEAIISLGGHEDEFHRIISFSEKYRRLADNLYIADEKNMVEEREKLFEILTENDRREIEIHIYAAILAIGIRFNKDNGSFFEIFDKRYNYIEKIERIVEIRSLKLWLTNYFSWIMQYSATKLNIVETDAIVRAKRYIADHYEDAELSLSKVAEHVGLNEKYLTNRFTKETGETFSAYLTALRIQKARELLKTTTFKVYEISEMVGYHSVEHFNRVFKKMNGISPAQYRKTM